MIFLAVFGGIALILAIFYLLNSIQNYGTWKFASLLVLLFALATGYAATNLVLHPQSRPKQPQQTQPSKKSRAAQQSSMAKTASEFNPTGNVINGQTEAEKNAARANAEQQMNKQLGDAFSKLGTVAFDAKTKTYNITPTNDDTIKAMTALEKNPENADQANWPGLTDNLRKSSANISKSLQADYTLALLSPDQDGKVLYSATNGKTVVDFTK